MTPAEETTHCADRWQLQAIQAMLDGDEDRAEQAWAHFEKCLLLARIQQRKGR